MDSASVQQNSFLGSLPYSSEEQPFGIWQEETPEEHYPQWPDANDVFAIANCFQNCIHDMANWSMTYCVTKTIQWIVYVLLTALLGFLLSLHCIMYKKINRRCSWKILRRNRVQILSLSVLMTSILFVKMTFMMDYADLVLLLFA